VSIQDMLDQVWTDVVVTPESVYQAIATLRRALGDKPGNPAYIVTVPRRGYRMIAGVSPAPPAPPAHSEPPPETAALPVPGRPRARLLVLCLAGLALSLAGVQVWHSRTQQRARTAPVTVTFDDLPTPGQEDTPGIGLIPASYAGLDWTCSGNPRCQVINGLTYGGNPSGYQGAVVSPPNVLSTGYGDGFVATHLKITRTGGGRFSLQSASFTSPWYDGLFVAIVGETDRPPFHNLTFTLESAGARKTQIFNWDNLTSVFITTSGGHPSPSFRSVAVPTLAIDDLTYTEGGSDGAADR
jgi:hypothetical protein